jgi:predicted GIY-YIG superfamily endonuclease
MATALYRFYNGDDVLLYVGITNDLDTRIRQHTSGKPWWPAVQRRSVEWFESRVEAEGAEIVAIKTEYPLHNVFHAANFLTPEEESRWYGDGDDADPTAPPTRPWIPVGIDSIASELGVSENTVIAWRRRSAQWVNATKFPESEGKISGRDWWWLSDVLDWAKETGRLKEPAGE